MSSQNGFWFEFVPDDSEGDLDDIPTWIPEKGQNFEAVKKKTHSTLEKVSSDAPSVKQTWEQEVVKVTSKCLAPSEKSKQVAQLVFGRVQAGKTSNFTGVISLLMDNGYDLFIVVAGINLNLRDQTFDRLRKDLGVAKDPGFEVLASDPRASVESEAARITDRLRLISEPSGHFGSKFKKRLVYVILKEITHLSWINEVLGVINKNHINAQFLENASTLVIDDETDQASPDTYEKKDDQTGAIHEALATLRANLPTHTYAGYTATPYANLLMAETNRLKCTSISVLNEGPDYVGPERLFLSPELKFPELLPDWDPNRKYIPESLCKAYAVFIVQAAIMNSPVEIRSRLTESPFSDNNLEVVPCSMLIHASQRVNEAQKVFEELTKLKQGWVAALKSPLGPNGLRDKSYNDLWGNYLKPACLELFGEDFEITDEFRDIVETIAALCSIRQINGPGKAQGFTFPSEEEFEKSPAWVLIGGQLLDRGQTLPHLVNTYMPRPPAGTKGNEVRGQFDTLQQRGRFYGQRRQYAQVLRGWFENAALETYKKIGVSEPKHIQILKRLEESGLSLSKLHLVFELEGDMKLARPNVLPRDVFEMKSAKWLFRQTHFDSPTQSKSNLDYLKGFLELVPSLKRVGLPNTAGRGNFEVLLKTELAEEFLQNWSFSAREDKTKPVAQELIRAYSESKISGVRLVLMSRSDSNPKTLETFGEFRTAHKVSYLLASGSTLKSFKITGLTSSNDSKFIADDVPSIQVHFFDMKSGTEPTSQEVGLAIAFPNTTRVTGRKATND
jgi:hypothetical protein